jgi:predicted metal-dependent phosphoesterase TrpH
MYKVDLHTHSIISPDRAGSITISDYEKFLNEEVLDFVAITDHNETSFAQMMHKKHGDKIIIGEEITTTDGEMIGLFLQTTIRPGLSAQQTAEEIHKQGGLVYIPHPFEIFRKGLQKPVLDKLIDQVDIFEVFNGRGRFRGKTKEAEVFAREQRLIGAASSDAHGPGGIGNTFSIISEKPTVKSLKKLLREGSLHKQYASLWTYLYPAMNIVRNSIKLSN